MTQPAVVSTLLLLGVLSGFFLTTPVNFGIAVLLIGSTGLWAYSTNSHGLAGIPGALAFMGSVIIGAGQLITIIAVNVSDMSLDMSWLVRAL